MRIIERVGMRRRVMQEYNKRRVWVDSFSAALPAFSATNAILIAAISVDFPYKKYAQWAIGAAMAAGSFAAAFQYFRGQQGNIVHVESLYETGMVLDDLAKRFLAKYQSRNVAILKIQGLAKLIPENERPRDLIKNLADLRELMGAHSAHLVMLKKRLDDLRPSLKPIIFGSAIGQGYGYSLLVCSAVDMVFGVQHGLGVPFIVVASALFLLGASLSFRKEYHLEKSMQFISHYGEISGDLREIQRDFTACETLTQLALMQIENYFESLDLRAMSQDEVYQLYQPLIRFISSSERFSKAEFTKAYQNQNAAELLDFFGGLSEQYIDEEQYKINPSKDLPLEIVISGGLEFQMPGSEEDNLLSSSFSINQMDEESPLLHPAPKKFPLSKALYLLYKIPEGGYPLLAWLTLMNAGLVISFPTSAAVGVAFSGLKLLRCTQYERLLAFNPEALKAINDRFKTYNDPTLFSQNDLNDQVRKIAGQFFSDKNLEILSAVLRESEVIQKYFNGPRNRVKFWKDFSHGRIQLDSEQDLIPLNLKVLPPALKK